VLLHVHNLLLHQIQQVVVMMVVVGGALMDLTVHQNLVVHHQDHHNIHARTGQKAIVVA
jgi:hypothetical protein